MNPPIVILAVSDEESEGELIEYEKNNLTIKMQQAQLEEEKKALLQNKELLKEVCSCLLRCIYPYLLHLL